MDGEKIALWFTPANEGDFLMGLPARDLTEAEVEEHTRRHPGLMRDATAPHPTTGRALYSAKKPGGRQAAVPPPDAPETPAKGGEA